MRTWGELPAAFLVLGVIAGGVFAAPAAAQIRQQPDTSVRAILANLRRGEGSIGAMRVLTEEARGLASPKADALADSLVQLAITYREQGDGPGALEASRSAAHAVAVLSTSGAAFERYPYRGAFARLTRIFEQAGDIGIRGGALHGIAQFHDRPKALQYLRQVAISDDKLAYEAIRLLYEAGADGINILRELHRQQLVREPRAQRTIGYFARYHGW